MKENNQDLLETQAKLEAALNEGHRSKSLLEATIKSTASGVVVADLNVKYVLINPAGRRLLGKLADLGPEHWNQSLGLFESEDGRLYDEIELPLSRACRGQSVKRMEMLIRNGVSERPIWLEANATQILDLNGEPIGAVTVFDDITIERKTREGLRELQIQTASKLLDTNHQLEEVLNSIDETVWRGVQTDDGFRFVFVSPGIEKISGLKPEELTDKLGVWDSCVHPEDLKPVNKLFSEVASGKVEVGEIDFRIKHSDGSIHWVHNRIRPTVKDGEKYVHGIMSDITKERNARLSFARAQRLASVGTLAAGIAHEINNPLGAMLMTTELGKRHLENGTLSKEQTCTLLDDVAKQIERCADIVEGILKFASDQSTSRKIASLNPICYASTEMIEFKAKKRNIKFVIHENETGQPLAKVNETEIGQVVVNLLANAVDASPDDSSIEIFTRIEGDRVVVSVVDQGTGMTPQQEMSAFDPFFTSKRETGGTGLGLSMSHRIIENHNGEIWIAKTAPNKGSTFSFWLPLVSDETTHSSFSSQ